MSILLCIHNPTTFCVVDFFHKWIQKQWNSTRTSTMAAFMKKTISYSLKNIPTPSEDSYIKHLIHQTEKFITRLRWKAIFFLQKDKKEQKDESSDSEDEDEKRKITFGFNSANVPTVVQEISKFEEDMWDLVDNIRFSNKKTTFQKEMENDIKNIKKSKNVFIKADKTGNIYETSPETYKKMLSENITKDYKKTSLQEINRTNLEAKEITEKLKIDDRVEKIKCS